MNVILFEGEIEQTRFTLSTEQARHVRKILKSKLGDVLRIGLINGPIGTAKLVDLEPMAGTVELVEWTDLVPSYRSWHVVLALPRPPVFRRVLQMLGSFGVRSITVVNADKVEQSFWQSHVLDRSTIEHNLRLGMEQGITSYRPSFECLGSFSQLIEKVRIEWGTSASYWVADPSAKTPGFPLGQFQQDNSASTTHYLFVGPEGGWSERELKTFASLGMRSVSLGSSILKVEVAIAYLAGMLFQVNSVNKSVSVA